MQFFKYKPIGKKGQNLNREFMKEEIQIIKNMKKSSISRIVTDMKIQTMRFHTPMIGDNFPNLMTHCVGKSLK